MAKATDIIAQTFTGMAADIASAVLESVRAAQAKDKATNRQQGAYTRLTAIAAESGREDFEAATSAVMDAIRGNANGFATAIGAQPNKKGDAFTIPSGFMTAKSVLLSAFDHGVPMLDDESGEVRPFGQIRKDVKAAKDEELDAHKSDNDRALDEARAALSSLSEVLGAYAPKVDSKGNVESNVDDATADHLRKLTKYLAKFNADLDELNGAEDDAAEAKAA